MPVFPHFSSNLRLVSSAEFEQLPLPELRREGQYVGQPWTYKERLSHTKTGYTDAVDCCNAGGIQNGQHAMLFHLLPLSIRWDDKGQYKGFSRQVPGPETFAPIADAFNQDIQNLRQENPTLQGFLIGGQETNHWSTVFKNFLTGLFKVHDIPFSILWGQQGNHSRAHYTAETDTWTINSHTDPHRGWGGQDTYLPYREIHIAEGDTLLAGDQKISTRRSSRD